MNQNPGSVEDNISINLQVLEKKMHELKGSESEDALSEAMEELSISIEEMHAAEAELIESNKRLEEESWRYKELFDFAPDAYLVTNLYGIIKEANRAASDLLDAGQGMMIGKPLQVYIHKNSINSFRNNVELLRKGENVLEWEAWVAPRIGEPLPVAISVNPIRKPDGSLVGLRWMLHDMTEARRAEAELRSSKEAAEEAVKVKAAFMANMSHEFRTPMNAVIGMTSLLLEEPLTPEQRDFVETIRKGGEALMSLINEVLDFSKMDREEAELEIQSFDLRECIEDAIDLAASAAADKGLELAYVFSPGTPEAVLGDPARLRQILSNLLSNAVKFTDSGEVVITVFKNQQSDELSFEVSDTGIGIPDDGISKLFLPFTQLETSLSRGYEGTGLGLAISRRLVEMMGGKIWADSAPGQGSTFHFTIKAKAVMNKPKPFLAGQIKDKQALIVEGNRTLCRILCSLAKDWGMKPLLATTADEAALWLTRNPGVAFDLAIIDTNVQESADLAKDLRNLKEDLPLLMLTTIGQHVPDEIHALALKKPLKPAQLFDAVQQALARPHVPPAKEVPEGGEGRGLARVLLAEDNPSNQNVTLQMLRRMGYRADAVANGLEAIEALERQPYDVVLMDVRMPQMNGLEATRAIRKRFPHERQPVIIALTAYALAGDKEKCLDAGMDDYLGKPMQFGELSEMLEKHRPKAE